MFLCRGACWRAVLRVCPAWPVCGARSLPGRAAAQARGHTLSLAGPFGSMAGPVGARLWPGARQWGVCTLGGGGVRTPLLVFPALSLCPSSPACPACPPSSYPLGWPWPVGWSWRSDIVFLSCRAAWAGFVLRAGCSCGVPRRLAPVHRCARSVCGVVCTVSWASRLLFTGVHALRVVSRVRRPGPPGSCSPVCAPCVWCRVYGVLGLPAPVHRCARSACGVACTASWASRLLFTGVHALRVVLRVRRPGPPGSCLPVCTPCVWRRVYGVLGLPAPVHRCARSACGVACTASWASRPLFTGVHALRVVSCVRCPGPPGSCSPVCTPCVWCRVYGVLGLPAPVHRCARPVCGVACTASWASRPLFTGAHALRVALRVRRPGPPGSCSPACTLCVWCCVYGVLGLPAPVHRCARPACGVACTVSWASRLLFTGAHALRVALRVRRPGPPGSRHRCARPACGVVCMVSWASRLLFTGVHALRAVSRVRRPGPPGSCSPVCTPCVRCRVYGVLGLPAPVHRCARSVRGVVCTVSWASRLLFTGVHALRVALRVRRPGPPGSSSPVCTLCVWCCVYGVLGLPAPVRRCARSACGVACTASWASRLLFTGVHALASWASRLLFTVWCRVYGVLGLPAPVHRCARSACGVACTASWASRLLFTGVHALRVVSRVRCPGPPGSCSPVCTLCVWRCVYGVLGLPAPVHRCARSACGVACTASWASRLLFTGVHALRVVLRVRRPGPPGSCSPVCTPCVWCRVYGVLGLPAPVHRCARSACGVACTASWASRLPSPVCTSCVWCCVYGVLGLPAPVHRCARLACGVACTASWASRLLFTGVHALCAVSRVRCPGPPGSCSPVCTLCAWCCVYGVLGLPAPVHRCARSACGVACTASWASRLLFTGVHALCVVLRVRRPGPPGSCSPVRTLCVWCCVYGVLGLLAPVYRCARSVCGVACTASWASRLLFTGVHALCVVLRVRCPGLPGSCSPVRTPCVWCCAYGVLGLPAPVHRCVRSVWVCGGGWACLVVVLVCPCGWCWVWYHWACGLRLLGTHPSEWRGPGGPVARPAGGAGCSRVPPDGGVVLRVRRPGPPGSCSPVCTLCVYGVLGLPAPVHRCARPACGVACTVSWAFRLLFTGVHALCACAVSWASRLLFTGVRALCVVVRVRRPGPPGSRSPVCTLCVWCCVYGVLGLPARVHRCARPVRGVACAAWPFCACLVRVVLCVWCPGTLGSCSPVTRCVAVCVLCPVCGAACAVSWASRPLFTGARARCVAWCARCGCGCVLACAIPWPRRCGLFVFADTFFFTLCSLWRLIYSSRFGLFDFGDAQE